jgi:hypothetical protein
MLQLLTWLIQGAVGPAAVGLPVTWAATDLAGAAKRWFRRLRRSDGLSRVVLAASRDSTKLSDAEFAAVRLLLEQEETWVLAGRGLVEDLAIRIASCMPDRGGEGALAAGRAIAGGLLEFAVLDLEPEWFQRVLFARLERMNSDQASMLDQAMFVLHADLAALIVAQDAASAGRSARLLALLSRVLDRLPPGPADRGEVAVYLAALIRWLNSDPWPQDPRFAGMVLTPADVEQKLRIAVREGEDELELDADVLGRRCTRLVVLGAPGSGKTWLARRTARLCAEAALQALAVGAMPDEVELPLYTSCVRLAAAQPGDTIRRAVVSGALGPLPDLGGARVTAAVQVLFEERNAPTLLVADSLDEARGADDRIRQADTLPTTWRIVLTSRPGSWNQQLAIRGNDSSQRVGFLQPLRYPDDVEPFIASWFSAQPGWAADLIDQLSNRPALQLTATVPLILAFCCIIGGGQALPARRADLYAKVIRRILTGRWRGSGDRDADPDACVETLRRWAWFGAASNPVSGLGVWADEFATPRARQSRDDRDALDDVAVPLGPANTDTGMTMRRFVHRSIREHLVAEHIAFTMSAEQAAAELLNHLWYDPDWEYAGPATLAMHPQRDQVLKDLISHLPGGDQPHADLAMIDGTGQVRRFLARVAQESREGDWSPEAAELIGRARQDLAARHASIRQIAAPDWPTSTRLITRMLVAQLSDKTVISIGLPYRIAELAITEDERLRARELLLRLLTDDDDSGMWGELAHAIADLAPTGDERSRAREMVLKHVADDINWATVWSPLDGAIRLAVTDEEQAQTRARLLSLLASQTSPSNAAALADAIARLDPPEEDQKRARMVLLRLLADETNLRDAVSLAAAVAELDPSAEDQTRAREMLLRMIADEASPTWVMGLKDAVVGLAVTEEERGLTRGALLRVVAAEAPPMRGRGIEDLVAAVVQLAVTEQERAETREALLGLLADEWGGWRELRLEDEVVRLAVTELERAETREALLRLLADETNLCDEVGLANAVAALDPLPEDQARARAALLKLLPDEYTRERIKDLAKAVAALDPSPEDQARAREMLLDRLDSQTHPSEAVASANSVAGLDASPEDQAWAREILLDLLDSQTDPVDAVRLADAIARLDPIEEDQKRVRMVLLRLLADETNLSDAVRLAKAFSGLCTTAQDQTRAREVLLELLTNRPSSVSEAGDLMAAVAGLRPTVADLLGSHNWSHLPTGNLLAAVRKDTGTFAWLNALPLILPLAAER